MDNLIILEHDIQLAILNITRLCNMSVAELMSLGEDYLGRPICPLLKQFRDITILFEKYPEFIPANINAMIEAKRAIMDKENREWYAKNFPEVFAQVERWSG